MRHSRTQSASRKPNARASNPTPTSSLPEASTFERGDPLDILEHPNPERRDA